LAATGPGSPKFVTILLLDVRINLELLCFGRLRLVSLEVKANSAIRRCVNMICASWIPFEAVQPHDRLLFRLTDPKHNIDFAISGRRKLNKSLPTSRRPAKPNYRSTVF
jgi:hypothetical protein